jgi:lysozyme family protein
MSFDRAIPLVLKFEGGYVNDLRDPGGETNWGISKRAYPDLDIRGLTEAQARAIYRRDYWQPLRCDDIPWPLSLAVFDAGVNQGLQAATTMLQRVVGVTQDGRLGPVTLRAVNRAGPDATANYLTERALRYQGTRNFDRFGRGWLRRIFHLALEAHR